MISLIKECFFKDFVAPSYVVKRNILRSKQTVPSIYIVIHIEYERKDYFS